MHRILGCSDSQPKKYIRYPVGYRIWQAGYHKDRIDIRPNLGLGLLKQRLETSYYWKKTISSQLSINEKKDNIVEIEKIYFAPKIIFFVIELENCRTYGRIYLVSGLLD